MAMPESVTCCQCGNDVNSGLHCCNWCGAEIDVRCLRDRYLAEADDEDDNDEEVSDCETWQHSSSLDDSNAVHASP
jgi:hypothetical protein